MENNFGEELSTKITPIIILSYNRPELLKKLVEVIDDSSHSPIIVSQDGPKYDSDVEKIRRCIQICVLYSDHFQNSSKHSLKMELGILTVCNHLLKLLPYHIFVPRKLLCL